MLGPLFAGCLDSIAKKKYTKTVHIILWLVRILEKKLILKRKKKRQKKKTSHRDK